MIEHDVSVECIPRQTSFKYSGNLGYLDIIPAIYANNELILIIIMFTYLLLGSGVIGSNVIVV